MAMLMQTVIQLRAEIKDLKTVVEGQDIRLSNQAGQMEQLQGTVHELKSTHEDQGIKLYEQASQIGELQAIVKDQHEHISEQTRTRLSRVKHRSSSAFEVQ